jgi:outer membrane biogenesis lipoprotein LolB
MLQSRFTVALVATALLAGCAKNDQPPKDTTTATPVTQAAKPLTMADVAGKWQVRSTPTEGKDTTSSNYTIVATADTSPWMITFAGGTTTKSHVTLSGDSILGKTDVYTSARRKGAKVMTESVLHLKDGKLVGTVVAHYQVKTADSVLHLKLEGTRVP